MAKSGNTRITVKGLDFQCYVKIDGEHEVLDFHIWMKFREDVQYELIPTFVANLNRTKIVVQFSYTTSPDECAYLDGVFQLPYKYGFKRLNFIYMLRLFSTIFINAIRENDQEDLFFLKRPELGRSLMQKFNNS